MLRPSSGHTSTTTAAHRAEDGTRPRPRVEPRRAWAEVGPRSSVHGHGEGAGGAMPLPFCVAVGETPGDGDITVRLGAPRHWRSPIPNSLQGSSRPSAGGPSAGEAATHAANDRLGPAGEATSGRGDRWPCRDRGVLAQCCWKPGRGWPGPLSSSISQTAALACLQAGARHGWPLQGIDSEVTPSVPRRVVVAHLDDYGEATHTGMTLNIPDGVGDNMKRRRRRRRRRRR